MNIDKLLEIWEKIQKKIDFGVIAEKLGELMFIASQGVANIEIYKEISAYENEMRKKKEIENLIDDYEVFREMDAQEEALEILGVLEEKLDRLYMESLLGGEYDKNSAVITLHAGEGGDEAEDWTAMMARMYLRWAQREGFKATIIDKIESGVGMKKVSIEIIGAFAYGYLKSEAGTHRLVRVSPFDARGRRHTSFCAVEVIPELDEIIPEIVKLSDCEIQTFRSGGPGGQHQNKVESGIRLIHQPTGLIAECREGRSQIQNREKALKVLQGMIIEDTKKKNLEKTREFLNDGDASWGNAIRSYVFMPYQLVKDNRSGYETGRIDDVMDGELMKFMEAYLAI